MSARLSWRCWFTGWVIGWAVAIYFAAAMIAALGLSPAVALPGEGIGPLGSATFRVADLVSPQAKLALGALLGIFYLGVAGSGLPLARRALLAVAAALAATLAVLALLPATWSSGFGIGLAGTRFDGTLLQVYGGAAVLSGLIFALVEARCRRR